MKYINWSPLLSKISFSKKILPLTSVFSSRALVFHTGESSEGSGFSLPLERYTGIYISLVSVLWTEVLETGKH